MKTKKDFLVATSVSLALLFAFSGCLGDDADLGTNITGGGGNDNGIDVIKDNPSSSAAFQCIPSSCTEPDENGIRTCTDDCLGEYPITGSSSASSSSCIPSYCSEPDKNGIRICTDDCGGKVPEPSTQCIPSSCTEPDENGIRTCTDDCLGEYPITDSSSASSSSCVPSYCSEPDEKGNRICTRDCLGS